MRVAAKPAPRRDGPSDAAPAPAPTAATTPRVDVQVLDDLPLEVVGRNRPSRELVVGPPITAADVAAAEAKLDRVHTRIDQVRAEMTSTSTSLEALDRQIGAGLAEAERYRDAQAKLTAALPKKRKKRGLLGGLLTVAGFALGGPLGGIVGNLVGFRTIKSVSDLDSAINRAKRQLADANKRVANLRARREQIAKKRAPLDARAAELDRSQDALREVVRSGAPSARVRQLDAARVEARGLLADAKSLLTDYQRLAAEAVKLGVKVEALKADLAKDVEALQAFVAELDRAIDAALFELTFAVIAAAKGVGLITAPNAKLLRLGLSTVRASTEPDADRAAKLTKLLLKTVLPSNGDLAAEISKSVLSAISAVWGDRAEVEKLLKSAALSHAQRAWLGELLDLPAAVPIALVRAVIELGDDERDAFVTITRALAAVT